MTTTLEADQAQDRPVAAQAVRLRRLNQAAAACFLLSCCILVALLEPQIALNIVVVAVTAMMDAVEIVDTPLSLLMMLFAFGAVWLSAIMLIASLHVADFAKLVAITAFSLAVLSLAVLAVLAFVAS